MYTISEDGTLNKDGKMCYCVYTEGSCVASCAAFEERAKDRIYLCCINREIIAKPEIKSPVVNAVKDAPKSSVVNAAKNTPSADPLGLDALKTKRTKKTK